MSCNSIPTLLSHTGLKLNNMRVDPTYPSRLEKFKGNSIDQKFFLIMKLKRKKIDKKKSHDFLISLY
jgi:hypothetical protein